jgi:hypothetical protein
MEDGSASDNIASEGWHFALPLDMTDTLFYIVPKVLSEATIIPGKS